MKTIGIVSGLGAAAGARLYDVLVKECQQAGAKTDSDFPEVFLHNISSSVLDHKGIAQDQALRRVLSSSIRLLNECGADVIAIACNTAHVHHGVLQKDSRAKILNMVEIASEYAAKDCSTVGIISSRSTRDSGLYVRHLEDKHVGVIQATDREQSVIDGLISKAISGKTSFNDRRSLSYIIQAMFRRGAQAVILGCTELPLIGVQEDFYIDPGKLLVQKALLQ